MSRERKLTFSEYRLAAFWTFSMFVLSAPTPSGGKSSSLNVTDEARKDFTAQILISGFFFFFFCKTLICFLTSQVCLFKNVKETDTHSSCLHFSVFETD